MFRHVQHSSLRMSSSVSHVTSAEVGLGVGIEVGARNGDNVGRVVIAVGIPEGAEVGIWDRLPVGAPVAGCSTHS